MQAFMFIFLSFRLPCRKPAVCTAFEIFDQGTFDQLPEIEFSLSFQETNNFCLPLMLIWGFFAQTILLNGLKEQK